MNNQPKKLGELLPANLKSSETAVSPVHSEIIEAHNKGKSDLLTENDLRGICSYVIAIHGLKDDAIPTDESIRLIFAEFNKWFIMSKRINIAEVKLAFQMNVTGQLGDVHAPFGAITFEFMCKVCNSYLKRKSEELRRHKQPEPIETTFDIKEAENLLLKSIIADREAYEINNDIDILNSKGKLNILSQMFQIDDSISNIERLRQKAASRVVEKLISLNFGLKKAHEGGGFEAGFGKSIEIKNQIARIRSGKLITNTDDAMIRAEVDRLLVLQVFGSYGKDEMIEHIKGHIHD